MRLALFPRHATLLALLTAALTAIARARCAHLPLDS